MQRGYVIRNYFADLEIQPSLDLDIIRNAYKNLLLKVHPDKDGSTVRCQEVIEAFQGLRDESQRRRCYDAYCNKDVNYSIPDPTTQPFSRNETEELIKNVSRIITCHWDVNGNSHRIAANVVFKFKKYELARAFFSRLNALIANKTNIPFDVMLPELSEYRDEIFGRGYHIVELKMPKSFSDAGYTAYHILSYFNRDILPEFISVFHPVSSPKWEGWIKFFPLKLNKDRLEVLKLEWLGFENLVEAKVDLSSKLNHDQLVADIGEHDEPDALISRLRF